MLNGTSADKTFPEYAGGIGKDGLEKLKTFVQNGGTVIALAGATDLFVKSWGLPVKDLLAGLKTTDFFCPGSILDARVDNTHPIGYGMPEEASVFFARSSAFEIQPWYFAPSGQVRTIVKDGNEHVLQRGWM